MSPAIRAIARAMLPMLALLAATAARADTATAIFAGGCFWCVEADFDKVPGVLETVSGYTGGHVESPSYKQVTAGGTGHREAVKITYDPQKVSYQHLLDVFWHSVDPTDEGGQFCDRGESYATAIYATTPEQKREAEESKKALEKSNALRDPVVTPIETAGAFYPAEAYHQDYDRKNGLQYQFYRFRCGRDDRLEALWGDKALLGIKDKK